MDFFSLSHRIGNMFQLRNTTRTNLAVLLLLSYFSKVRAQNDYPEETGLTETPGIKPSTIFPALALAEISSQLRRRPPWPKRSPKYPPVTGPVNAYTCHEEKYRHLRSCYYTLHPAWKPRIIPTYIDQYLCNEKQKRRQQWSRGSRSKRFAGTGTHGNPCQGFEEEHPVETLEAEDMNGNIVELFHDIDSQLFQTFYKMNCLTLSMSGMNCGQVKIAVDTPIYIDDGDGNPINDVVRIRKVKIAMDCALHMPILT
uniref:uncharacterized protein LOC120345344 isoform X1 n=1 Tax=Styela clava TaxID=7725 RepID=UPI0019398D7D|nr:uncharacterized protein LOC120345344 isoform X1 [Styela clava]